MCVCVCVCVGVSADVGVGGGEVLVESPVDNVRDVGAEGMTSAAVHLVLVYMAERHVAGLQDLLA